MSIRIKSPNPDEIWEKWKQKALKTQKKQLEKVYKIKGAVFSIENIAAAEYVKNVNKEAAIYFEKSIKIEPTKLKPQEYQINWRKMENVQFFDFKNEVDKSKWKFGNEVASYKSISKIQCLNCNGKGYYEKKKSCNNCKNGSYHVFVEVINEKGEKSNKELDIKCPKCYGEGVFIEKEPCKNCLGTGSLFKYQIMPVPFKRISSKEPVLLASMKLAGLEKELGKEIQDAFMEVGGIQIKNPDKELDESFIEPTLGYTSKGVKNILKQAKSEWKEFSKNQDLIKETSMYLFPLIQLECVTSKGKKFFVYGIGTSEKFIVFGKL